MNTFNFRHMFIVAALLAMPFMVAAQSPHPILRVFQGQVIDDYVRLNWIITGGNTCEGIRIQRSAAGSFFTTIGEIDGVCGSPDADIPYIFVDEEPLEFQTGYYRLELGTQGYSTPVSITYVPLNKEGFNLQIDHAARRAVVNFDNPMQNDVDYQLLSLNGTVLLSGSVKASNIGIPLFYYPRQLLILQVRNGNRQFAVKIPNF
ncbi:MAG: hypothetical protein ACLFPE_07575 [Bacteroidales bacterium]